MLLDEMVIDENNVGFIPSLGISFEVNETAKRIIELIKEGKSKEDIVKIISDEFDVSWGEAYADVEDFFIKLKVYGLIQ